jgi:peptidoglycan/LPS O-acetylase OafA/YrhL
MDNLRWVTVLLVLVYHVFYFFNNKGVFGGIGGFVDDPMKQPQDVILYVLYPWFMMLLFLVAGISARYALGKKSGRAFMKSRTLKLLVPSTIGLLVFHWMVGYFNTVGIEHFAGMPLPVRWVMYAVSGMGPMWFVQDLWLMSLLLVIIKKFDGRDRLWSLCGRASSVVIVLLGLLVWLGSQMIIMNPRLESLDGLFNLYKPQTYFIPFLLGYFVFSHDAVQEKVERMHLPMLVCAVVTCVALVWMGWGKDYTSPQYLTGWLNCLYAWFAILAMLGCFMAWADGTNRLCAYMTRSSYGIYIVHYLVVVSLGYMMKMYTQLAPWAIYVILLVAVLLLSPTLYEVLRRIPFVRWCVLGMNKESN